MNMTLSVLNVAALVALVAFHFQDDVTPQQAAAIPPQPHHLLRQAPQLAIMTEGEHKPQAATLANDGDTPAPSSSFVRSETRWVF